MPAITILMPVWNGLPFIREAVDSVLAQDFSDWELIISDNGSTDGTLEYLTTLSDPRIHMYRQAVNLGIFGNLNFLFAQARAPAAYILCADDYLLPSGLRKITQTWASMPPEVAYVRFNFGEMLKGSSLTRYSFQMVKGIIFPEQSDFLFYIFGNLSGNLSNISVRTKRVLDAGGFREDLPYAGDFEMWSRMGRQWPWFVTDTETVFVRRHEGVASNYLNKKGELVAQQRKVVDSLYLQLAGRAPTPLLKLHGTVNYDSLQRDVAMKALIFGRQLTYLRQVNEAIAESPAVFPQIVCWLIYIVTGGGRWGRRWIASRLLASAR
jgi:glycosyltransferase involved in cell wall biosynthesis